MKKRTIYTPNEIVLYDDYAELILYNKYCEEIARALIDLDDVDKVKHYKWGINGVNNHVKTNKTKNHSKIYLHRLVMNPDDDMEVDHINGNPLDNRKSNLRVCRHDQNLKNLKVRSNNSSGITGVSWHKRSGKWRARIGYNGKDMHLGFFDTKEEAIEARKQAELEYFGEYRNKRDEE